MENYYAREDNQVTQSSALATWDATVRSLECIAPEIAERLNTVYEQITDVWRTAEQRGDAQTMTAISASWDHIYSIATKSVLLDAGVQTAKDVVKVLASELDKVDAEFAELQRAIEAVDTRHFLVDELVDDVRQMIESDVVCEIEQRIDDGRFYEMTENIILATGLRNYFAVNRFLYWLQFGGRWTDEQTELLTALVGSFAKES